MPDVKPISIHHIEFDKFDATNDGNICATFTPVGGVKKVVIKKYSELSAPQKATYDSFVAMLNTFSA